MGRDTRPAPPRRRRLGVLDAPVVELRRISRTFGSDPPVQALRGVDLTVERGDAIAIVGPSGSGKSTLLNIVGCLDRPTGGTYLIDGTDTALLGEDELSELRGRLIGFVFQTFNLLAHRTVVENVMLAEVYLGRPREGRRARALAALERVGISERADFSPAKLSGGQQQRAAIARALMGSPSLLLCDEPTGNLDTTNSATVLALFEELVDDGMTMLLITHDESVAERMPRRTSITDGLLTEVAL
ncbi:MAG: putative transport system permease protein [Solirubrobacteraceae bacterium]|nr:putative transport system permease protein [Solirubrobacteraceae bacterium]